MRAERQMETSLKAALTEMGLSWPEKAVIEIPREAKHGDLSSNVALVLAKQAGMPPRELAGRLAEALRRLDPQMQQADVAGPGFLNVTFSPAFWHETVLLVEKAGDRYGACDAGLGRDGEKRRVQVEYVSANPTGPLHIGHGRGAAVGDSLARILRFAGFDVETEYYLNDAGRQMRLLGLSVWLRVKELAGLPVDFPEDWYRGEYIIDIAREMLNKDPRLADLSDEEGQARCFPCGMERILDGIKEELSEFRAEHQVWFSEKSLVDGGAVEAMLDRLREQGLAFEKDGALWCRTGDFGDDKDRVLRKSDGFLTYFASDIAYHDDKFRRGFDWVVDVWGADHHGYVPRMKAAMEALGHDRDKLDVVLIQLVNLLRNGKQVAMSTRAGEFVPLRDVVREVGVDAVRFMFLSRKTDSHLDFDLELVKQRSMDNPVYYVQYAHARIMSVLRKAVETGLVPVTFASGLAPLDGPDDLALLRAVDRFEGVVRSAALALEPHHISFYLMELSGLLHSYYARYPVLQAEEAGTAVARLALLRAVGHTLKNGLALLGVSAPDSM